MMTKVPTRFALASFAATLALSTAAFADDGGLYEKPLDPNSAFVRVIAPGATTASVQNSAFNQLEEGVSPYVAVAPGDIPVSSSFGEGSVKASAGKFYSVVVTNAGATTVVDDMTKNPSKATLSLYNLTEKAAIDLFVPQAGAEAVSDVDSGGSKSVALRAPLAVDLVVREGDKDLAKLDKVEFKRLAGVTIVVTGEGDQVDAVAVPSTIAR
ncbi:alginate O-acetyltransferase complex protein AlgF [Rhizobium sp. RU33A]|uniref:alginate O-acetyltransferase AlgF n=1 Tax=Rhizobium sp. RU33A TaxID=1907413 RepID=UPI000953F04A|nr:alginate O-acetyltransferase AlgF [Rhizobium sp. RU33A]SIQ19945.1 alginate O-acetyltransferase complex protein AlgF [Rhizobium sp. RU33A]